MEDDAQPRKTPKQARSRATVDAILTATAQVLQEEGYAKTSTNRVARRAGVSIGTLYQYFSNKDAMIRALVERRLEKQWATLSQHLAAAQTHNLSLRDAALTLIRALMSAQRENPELLKVLLEEVPRSHPTSVLDAIERRSVQLLRPYLEARKEKLRRQNLDMAAFITVSSYTSVIQSTICQRPEVFRDPEKADALAEELADLLTRYLLA